MKGLLHSKKFKDNLKKWLCMYVGVILLLTTVITYSKYISSFQGNDKVETAKFNLKLEEISVDNSTHLVTDPYIYKFLVDVSEIDVKSTLKLLTFVDKSFTIENISSGFVSTDNNEPTQTGKQMRVLELKIPDDLNSTLEFEVEIKYNNSDNIPISQDINDPTKFEDVITFGYKIVQDDIA